MRPYALIIIFLIATALLSHSISAQQESITLTGWVMVPAVEDGGGGSLINITVTIKIPGSGNIKIISNGGESGIGGTTRSSMDMGVKTGSLYAGYYWRSIDAVVRIDTRENVEGPSGSFAVALLTYMLLTYNTNMGVRGFTVTGAISPDGLSSRVGGVNIKCDIAEREGFILMLPLANALDVGPTCKSMIAVGGLFSGLKVLSGLPEINITAYYPLPEGYNSGMRNVALGMISNAEKILRRVEGARVPWTTEWIRGNISRANQTIDRHPYAAASFAFTAYITALQIDYYVNLTGKSVTQAREELLKLRSELEDLKAEIDLKPRSGSIYYVEFLATAYTRLADANTTLLYAEDEISSGGEIANIAFYLGFTKARLESVRAWLSIADSMREEKPVIGEDTVKALTLYFRDYVRSSVDYASTLTNYVIRNYNTPPAEEKELKRYLDVVKGLVDQGDIEMVKGNYLAALGFYREAFSKSLARLFTPPNVMVGDIAEGYIRELSNLQFMLTSAMISRGLLSGLAPAYRDYAMVRYNLGDLDATVNLLKEAVASTILWYTLTLRAAAIPGSPPEIGSISPPAITLSPGRDSMAFYITMSLLIFLSFLLGVTLSAWLSYRATRST